MEAASGSYLSGEGKFQRRAKKSQNEDEATRDAIEARLRLSIYREPMSLKRSSVPTTLP
jgi:hypothetical protein